MGSSFIDIVVFIYEISTFFLLVFRPTNWPTCQPGRLLNAEEAERNH